MFSASDERTCSGFALHLEYLQLLSKEIFLVLCSPLVDFFSHRTRRCDGKDKGGITGALKYQSKGMIGMQV